MMAMLAGSADRGDRLPPLLVHGARSRCQHALKIRRQTSRAASPLYAFEFTTASKIMASILTSITITMAALFFITRDAGIEIDLQFRDRG
ncbi:MAG: hypothetical protein K0S56_1154 [Microvirga sp.]|nr:hypothetical protein [Microvirga sp.]